VLPKETWLAVNDLHLYTESHHDAGVDRRNRARFLERIIVDHQHMVGIMMGTMLRDEVFVFMRLGRHVERADMSTRVLDVRASSLMAEQTPAAVPYEDIQWTSVLRSLSALQMFHRSRRVPVGGPATLEFILHEPSFPRSVTFCLDEVLVGVSRLPRSSLVLPSCRQACDMLASIDATALDAIGVHDVADALQASIGDIHDAIAATYFWSHSRAG
jgi:uncharacterized alpha-E superfamily protein